MATPSSEAQSLLLRLLGELRNRIYKFALTAPRSLVLNFHTSNPDRPALYLPPDEYHPDKNHLDVAAHTAAFPLNKQVCDGQCHSYNQLKLVKKQLYQEIKRLELRFKDVRLLATRANPSSERLSSFTSRMSHDQRSWFCTLIIDSDFEFEKYAFGVVEDWEKMCINRGDIDIVLDFCNNHSDVHVIWLRFGMLHARTLGTDSVSLRDAHHENPFLLHFSSSQYTSPGSTFDSDERVQLIRVGIRGGETSVDS
ncbi:hypothetical protein BU23DRAFT_637173 [Bimuria novae-zelandiae CBS 107.79]|uniref:Uncharacterized protein n=1 Tax=Bimuria novae-zelandiae CBS 107.79 TaxID=1447943 RepID=A0A6A5VY60_9PLEO|nr:hypothetical protein BU23DRAFT_637173 [Bimuria novae-zelandiae CBS 107.79]